MKVYLATKGSYSDYRVLRVFSKRDDAEAYELAERVEEFELEEHPVETRLWHQLSWYPDEPDGETEHKVGGRSFVLSNPRWERPRPWDYDGSPNNVEHGWRRTVGSGCLELGGWDAERVRKVYGELRAEWLNCKALGMVWDPETLEWTAPEPAPVAVEG